MLNVPSVWGAATAEIPEMYQPPAHVPSALQDRDAISGEMRPDVGNPTGRVHGIIPRANTATMQTPVPVGIGGGSGMGVFAIVGGLGELIAKAPAMMAMGADVVGQVFRGQRYPAISRVRPETTGTIGGVARQSFQYVRPLVPYPYPSNAFGNPNIGGEVRQIDATIQPALEPPRYNLTALDTEYLQQQHDTLVLKTLLRERGMG